MSTTTQAQKGKQCNRCGNTIVWNNTSRFFESTEYPKFLHCCPLPCNKEGWGGTIYFSNIAPKSEETGRSIPLDFPVPQVSKTDPAKMEWIVHVHKNNIPAEAPATAPPATVPEVKAPETKPLAPGQNTLEYKPEAPTANTGISASGTLKNQDVDATILSTLNDMNQRLASLEKYANESLVPVVTQLTDVMNNIIPKLNVIAGKIAEGSIKSASDLVEHHLST
jgi:hypothetical protein